MEWTLFLTVIALVGQPLEGKYDQYVTSTGNFPTKQQCEAQGVYVLRVIQSARPRAKISIECRVADPRLPQRPS